MKRLTLALFLFFQGLYALTSSGNAFRIPDEFEVYFQVEHLVDAGDLSVPQTLAIRQPQIVDGKVVGSQSVFFGKVGLDGKPYAPYGPLAAVLSLPHHLAGRALAWALGIPRVPVQQGLAWVMLVGGVTMLVTATGAALAVAGFMRAALALGTPAQSALVLSLLLGGATVLWPYGATLYSEALQAAALVWAAALLLEAREGHASARRKVVAAALLLMVAGLTKVTCLVFVPGFVVATLADRSCAWRRRVEVATALSLGILLAVAIHVWWNLFRFGAPFDVGYDWSETIPRLPARAFLLSDLPRGLVLLLVSPGKSLFLWAPVLALAAAGATRFWRHAPHVALGLATSFAIAIAFYAAYLFPEGGYSHGPRNLVPLIPLLLLPAAGPKAIGWPRPVIGLCAAVGVTMALLATSVSFLEDQAMGAGPGGPTRGQYYDVVDPAPGRAANRYRLGYIPFVTALRSPDWIDATGVGRGPDYFPRHMWQAIRQVPDGRTIPVWFPWVWPAAWLALTIGAARALWTRSREEKGVARADAPPPLVDQTTPPDASIAPRGTHTAHDAAARGAGIAGRHRSARVGGVAQPSLAGRSQRRAHRPRADFNHGRRAATRQFAAALLPAAQGVGGNRRDRAPGAAGPCPSSPAARRSRPSTSWRVGWTRR